MNPPRWLLNIQATVLDLPQHRAPWWVNAHHALDALAFVADTISSMAGAVRHPNRGRTVQPESLQERLVWLYSQAT